MSQRANRSIKIGVHLTPGEKASLERAAKIEKTNVSDLVRRSVFPAVREILYGGEEDGPEHLKEGEDSTA